MSDIDTIIDKISQAYQPINKTVSDLGSSINKTERIVARLETKLDDAIERIDKKMDSHDVSIAELDTAKVTIMSSISMAKWIGTIAIGIILTLGSFIVTSWSQRYDERLKTLETERKQAYEQFIKILGEKKNYLNQSAIESILANL